MAHRDEKNCKQSLNDFRLMLIFVLTYIIYVLIDFDLIVGIFLLCFTVMLSLNNIRWILNHLLFFYHMFWRMEDFHINNTSQDKSFNYSNITSNYSDSSNVTYLDPYEFPREVKLIIFVVSCIIIAIGLLLTLVAIYVLCSLVRNFWLLIYLITVCVMCLLYTLSVCDRSCSDLNVQE